MSEKAYWARSTTIAQDREIVRLRREGLEHRHIAAIVGCSKNAVLARLTEAGLTDPAYGRPTNEEYRRKIREIPPDTRDLCARLMGDPLPGRSALDQHSS